MARVERLLVSAACNRFVKAAAWGQCGLVAFGVHSLVAIYSPERAAIQVTLPAHKEQVTCVEWIRSGDSGVHLLLSGSADGAIVLWDHIPARNKWEAVCHVKVHTKPVTCLFSMTTSSTQAIVASSSSDSTVCVWKVSWTDGCYTTSQVQSIGVGSRLMLSVSMAYLPGASSDHIILAMGGLDNHIHLYVGTNSGEFSFVSQLKGHQDWIRCVDFSKAVSDDTCTSIFLASSSQDRHIRIWRISPAVQPLSAAPSLKEFIEGPLLSIGGAKWRASLESLLIGHEDWVYSVLWQPASREGRQSMSVLSSSMDKTMMIWRPASKSGIWMNEVTVGELGNTAFGFYGGLWSPDGEAILAHGLNGSLHLWRNSDSGWRPQLVPSGHFGAVVDIDWAEGGQFLLSASHDQTTRVFACCDDGDKSQASWHEIARPQIHGHDINCIAVVRGKGNHRYASGADEKVARIFGAPASFLGTLSCLTNESVEHQGVQVLGANMSALGLSQKPIYTQGEANSSEAHLNTMEVFPDAVPSVLTEPPLEEQLAQNTLWPEVHKLYGHGNELYAMCCSYDGKILATACKAQTPSVAEIWLWETKAWRPIQQLQSHSLTVAQMAFSHRDGFLLSVSRDRHFSLFRSVKDPEGNTTLKLVTKTEAHKRIVWSCAWSTCDKYFATGSRDKTVKVWCVTQAAAEQGGVSVKLSTVLPMFSSSVTALSWSRLLAVGTESGQIELWNPLSSPSCCVMRFDAQDCHSAAVNRLVWREQEEGDRRKLASCGADHTVRIFSVQQ